jgi:circadian clock protein KaiC
MPDSDVSSLVDNIILLNYVELENSMRRAVTVVKARGSDHQFRTHEFKIQQGGMVLSPLAPEEAPALPFQSYHGLLSRAPTRIPKTDVNGAHRSKDRERAQGEQ